MKIVINRCFGGFGLSAQAERLLAERGVTVSRSCEETRADPALVSVVETLGSEKASGEYAELKVVEIPDGVEDWYITDYDGNETIHEGRQWR